MDTLHPQTRERKLLAEWFWADRWMGSSAFLLPIGARGLYREMLTQAWRRGARLPHDFEAIRRAVGCTRVEWNRYWPRIQGYWRIDGANLVNDTQCEVYQLALARQDRASRHGAQGARGRWKKNRPIDAQANAQALPEQSVSIAQGMASVSVSDLSQRAERDTRARGAGNRSGVAAGSFPGDHLDHLACGPVCFSARMVAKFVGRFGHDREKLAAWAQRVCARETASVAAGQPPSCGDDFDYWTAAYDADFGQPKIAAVSGASRRVPDADDTAHYLAELRGARA
jgi:uncharacterized protein YdaU (DUF1376 family)